MFGSEPNDGQIFIAERSRKGSRKLLWSVMPEAPIAADFKVPLILTVPTAQNLTEQGNPFLFRINANNAQLNKTLADYVARNGLSPLAFIAWSLALLGERPLLFATAGSDASDYRDRLARGGVDVSGLNAWFGQLHVLKYLEGLCASYSPLPRFIHLPKPAALPTSARRCRVLAKSPILRLEPFSSRPVTGQRSKNSCA